MYYEPSYRKNCIETADAPPLLHSIHITYSIYIVTYIQSVLDMHTFIHMN